MKQINAGQRKAYEELLAVTKWTIQMLDADAITHGQCSAIAKGEEEQFRAWETAVRASVAKAEVVEGFLGRSTRTHADVQLPRFNQVVKQPCGSDSR